MPDAGPGCGPCTPGNQALRKRISSNRLPKLAARRLVAAFHPNLPRQLSTQSGHKASHSKPTLGFVKEVDLAVVEIVSGADDLELAGLDPLQHERL